MTMSVSGSTDTDTDNLRLLARGSARVDEHELVLAAASAVASARSEIFQRFISTDTAVSMLFLAVRALDDDIGSIPLTIRLEVAGSFW